MPCPGNSLLHNVVLSSKIVEMAFLFAVSVLILVALYALVNACVYYWLLMSRLAQWLSDWVSALRVGGLILHGINIIVWHTVSCSRSEKSE